jgi:hypothetical protein
MRWRGPVFNGKGVGVGSFFLRLGVGVYPIFDRETTIGMKILLINDPHREGGGMDRGPVFLSVQSFQPSRYELWRQLCVARDWVAVWAVAAALGWLTVLVLILL